MLKQHCEVCDCVIPPMDSYRTVRYGRGNNPNVNTGHDPMVICKACWKKMIAVVSPEMASNLESAEHTQEMKDKLSQKLSEALKDDLDRVIKGKDKSCESCRYGDGSLNEEPCNGCTGKNQWEAKNVNT